MARWLTFNPSRRTLEETDLQGSTFEQTLVLVAVGERWTNDQGATEHRCSLAAVFHLLASAGLKLHASPFFPILSLEPDIWASKRLQLRKLSCSSEWPLLLLWIFLCHHYYRVKSMHMISTMDFFFISCVKCQSVNRGAAGAAWQITLPTPPLEGSDNWN